MSVSEIDDLTTDSVPDSPRENADSANVNGHSKSDTKENRNEKKKEPKTKSSKTSKTPPLKPDFNFPHQPTGSTTYNINGANNLHIGNVFNFNVGASPAPKASPVKKDRSMSRRVAELLNSSDPVTEDDLDIVAGHVGKDWKTLGNGLGLTIGELEQIELNCKEYTSDFKEIVYQMLLKWKQDKDTKATVGILCKRLWKTRQYDAAEQLAKERSLK